MRNPRAPEARVPPAGAPRRFAVLELAGTPRERGQAHGRHLKAEIAAVVDRWKRNLARESRQDADDLIRDFLARTAFLTAVQRWTPDLLEEVRGLSEGAGQTLDTLFAFQLMDELWVHLEARGAHHCSALGLAARGRRPARVAQNMDLETFRQGFQAVLHIHGTDTVPEQHVFTCAGLVGLNGVNRCSVGVVVNTLMDLPACADGLPVAFVVRGLLERRTGPEAIRFLEQVKHASGQNYLLGCGDLVHDFEAGADRVHLLASGTAAVCHTNHALGHPDRKAGCPPAEGQLRGDSQLRLESLETRLNAPGPKDLAWIKATLRAKDAPDHPVCRPWAGRPSQFTFGSSILTLGPHPSLEIAFGSPDAARYHRLAFTRAEAEGATQ